MRVFEVTCNRISNRSKKFQVKFDYHQEVINKIKELPRETREWEPHDKSWTINSRGLFYLIRSYKNSDKIKFEFGTDDNRTFFIEEIKRIQKEDEQRELEIAELEKNKKHWVAIKEKFEKEYEKYNEVVHKNLKEGTQLYPFQIPAVLFLNETKNALLAFEMGTGKSLISISYVEMNDFEKVIIITPNSLKFNYYNEVEKFTNSKAHIVNWKKNKYTVEESKYIIFNYEYLNPSDKKKMDAKFAKLNIDKIDAVISDECHRLKNSSTNTYKNFKRLFTKKIFRNGQRSLIFMSGTPAPNRAYELYTILNQISPIDFATKKYFYEYYCGMTYDMYNGYGWETDFTKQKLEELFHKISPFTYRKKKEDVLKDLPDITYEKIIFEFTPEEARLYADIESDVVNELNLKPSNNPLTTLLRLRQYTSICKVNRAKELLDNIIDTDQKFVFVDDFKAFLYETSKKFPNISSVHTGDQTVEERNDIVTKFQDIDSDLKIFLGSIQTCNYGLTLTASNTLFIVTVPYSVGQFDQVAARCHRIGQDNHVMVYVLIFRDSIDEMIYDSLVEKRKEISKVIDNEDYVDTSEESVVNNVIAELKRKHANTTTSKKR